MDSNPRVLTALPVYNEASHVNPVLDEVVRYAGDVLVVDDGSTDGTSDLLAARARYSLHSPRNESRLRRGAEDRVRVRDRKQLRRARDDRLRRPARAAADRPACRRLPRCRHRFRQPLFAKQGTRPPAPAERRQINTQITRELNERSGLSLTDAFCGFKAYRVPALAKLTITEPGYGMPIELWVQAAHHGLRIVELPVPLIYLEEDRSFGGSLDDGRKRLEYYHRVLDSAIAAAEDEQTAGTADESRGDD